MAGSKGSDDQMSTDHSGDWRLAKSQCYICFQLSLLRGQKILFIPRSIWSYCSSAQTLPLSYIKCGRRSLSLCNTVNYRHQNWSCGEGTEGHLRLRENRSMRSRPVHEPQFLWASHVRTAALAPASQGKRTRGLISGGRSSPGEGLGGRGAADEPKRKGRPGRAPPPQRYPRQPGTEPGTGSTSVPNVRTKIKMEDNGRKGD